jgi:hypothetical protein
MRKEDRFKKENKRLSNKKEKFSKRLKTLKTERLRPGLIISERRPRSPPT